MEILFLLSAICLILFIILATYDGAYLHLWKYELFNHKESIFEHKTHTLRSLLFPFIIWLVFINTNHICFMVGLTLVFLDLIVLGVDAYAEKDSRSFMNGLPRWEYILHLFVNSLHFSAIILVVATRLKFEVDGITYSTKFITTNGFKTIQFIALNILPGAILLAILHFLLMFEFGKVYWKIFRSKTKRKEI